jgi:hypothetical protein
MGKWLDFLKREHSDTHLALFLAFGGVLLLHHFGFFPALDTAYPWVFPLAVFGFMLFGFLFALAALSAFLSGRGP